MSLSRVNHFGNRRFFISNMAAAATLDFRISCFWHFFERRLQQTLTDNISNKQIHYFGNYRCFSRWQLPPPWNSEPIAFWPYFGMEAVNRHSLTKFPRQKSITLEIVGSFQFSMATAATLDVWSRWVRHYFEQMQLTGIRWQSFMQMGI